jgi:hypothetical protein
MPAPSSRALQRRDALPAPRTLETNPERIRNYLESTSLAQMADATRRKQAMLGEPER